MLSEKATSERMKRRGLHHPLTRDSILLRVNTIQKVQCTDEVGVNMECNARLRDSWGPHTPQGPLQPDLQALKRTHRYPPWDTREGYTRRAKTSVPILKRAASQNTTNTNRAQPHSADTHRAIKRVSGFTTSATEGPRAPECRLMRSLPNPESSIKTSTSLRRISPVGPSREQTGFRLLTVTQLEDFVRAKTDLIQSCEQKRDKKKWSALIDANLCFFYDIISQQDSYFFKMWSFTKTPLGVSIV